MKTENEGRRMEDIKRQNGETKGIYIALWLGKRVAFAVVLLFHGLVMKRIFPYYYLRKISSFFYVYVSEG